MRRFLGLLLVAAACATGPDAPPAGPAPNAALGRVAFDQECARCHASGDGFDLAFFGFDDATIVRRAVAHVDTATARDIVAHVRTIRTASVDPNARLFQPGGQVLASDLEFALALFGQDGWPAGLTTAQLAAIDPRAVRVAVRMPAWSDERTNLDWMPDTELPPVITAHAGGQVAAAVAGYRAAPTGENLRRAVLALRAADRVAANPEAPCRFDEPTVDFRTCFEARRWVSTLVAQHMVRYGVSQLAPELHDVWWDVGNAARKSRADGSVPVARPVENWASWMLLGWTFNPGGHPSVYTGGGLLQLGLARHATFIALRSQVARQRGSRAPYEDAAQAARFAPPAWALAATTFALRHLLERLAAQDRPARAETIPEAVAAVQTAVMQASRKVAAADRAQLAALGAEVVAELTR